MSDGGDKGKAHCVVPAGTGLRACRRRGAELRAGDKIVSQIEVERTAEQKPNVCVECGGVYNYSRDALCERCRNRKRREHEEMRKAAGAYRRREFYRKGKKQ